VQARNGTDGNNVKDNKNIFSEETSLKYYKSYAHPVNDDNLLSDPYSNKYIVEKSKPFLILHYFGFVLLLGN
jgi:hypothetical protein